LAANVLVDASFLVALLNRRDANHGWARAQSQRYSSPWRTCDSALAEAFHLLGERGARALAEMLRRRAVVPSFDLGAEIDNVLKLMQKFADVPMSLADACLVRMTEVLPEPVLLTTDLDFHVYRRHTRLAVPCVMPS
jgi:predicted nucleic acid-binding protein